MEDKNISKPGLGRTIRNQFMAGLLVIIPLAATILILIWLFNSIDNILQPVINAIWHRDIPGVGFGVTIILIFLTGVVARNVIGKRILKYGESLLAKVPIFKELYHSIRQIVNSFSASNKTGFMQVVLVEFPMKGQKAIGFVTNEVIDRDGKKLLSVLIPTAPTPTSGFLQIVKEEDVIRTQISVDDAMKMIVSAGLMMPDGVQNKI
jgi:uncharacterized membrane protein